MARARRNPYRDWVRKVCAELRGYLYLEAWQICYVWDRPARDAGEEATVVASIRINGDYLEATLYMHPLAETMWDEGDIEGVARVLVHEFCHILTEPLYLIAVDGVTNPCSKYLESIREQQTQRIALAVFRGIPEELYSL